MAVAVQMVVRGLDYDYVIIGMGVAALASDGLRSEEWLDSALEMQRMVFGRAETGVRAHICGDLRGRNRLRGPAGVGAVIVKDDRGSQPAADSG